MMVITGNSHHYYFLANLGFEDWDYLGSSLVTATYKLCHNYNWILSTFKAILLYLNIKDIFIEIKSNQKKKHLFWCFFEHIQFHYYVMSLSLVS